MAEIGAATQNLAGIKAMFIGIAGGALFADGRARAGGFQPNLAGFQASGLFGALFGRPRPLFAVACHGDILGNKS